MKTYIKPTTRSFALSMEQHLMNTSVNTTTGKGSSDLVDGTTPYNPSTMTIGARRQNDVWGPEDEEEEER